MTLQDLAANFVRPKFPNDSTFTLCRTLGVALETSFDAGELVTPWGQPCVVREWLRDSHGRKEIADVFTWLPDSQLGEFLASGRFAVVEPLATWTAPEPDVEPTPEA